MNNWSIGNNGSEYSINVPLFDGTVFIHMRSGHGYRRNRSWRRNRYDWNNRNYSSNRSVSNFESRGRRAGSFDVKSEVNSTFSSQTPSRHVVNPFSTNMDCSASTSLTINELERNEPVVIVHGGAGNIADSSVDPKLTGVKKAATVGYQKLIETNNVIDAVEAAVISMEKDPAFNAGLGSCLNLSGEIEMEASIQRGSDLAAGGVTLINNFEHPISIARKVMEETPHSLLGGEGAKKFAVEQGFTPVDPKCLITQAAIDSLNKFKEVGGDGGSEIPQNKCDEGSTVGAVAIDAEGHIAVATSTGGRTGKYVGRIGDTPQIGSGTYADDSLGGVSTTGHGESILKTCLAHTIVKNIQFGLSAQDATQTALVDMTRRMKNTAGAITISRNGGVGIHFTSERMAWSYIKGDRLVYGIEPNQQYDEKFDICDTVS